MSKLGEYLRGKTRQSVFDQFLINNEIRYLY